MLNINSRISLSSKSKKIIKKYKKKSNGFNKGSWSAIHKSVKNDLSKKLLINQNFKCAYCERQLIALNHQIDHFAHKADYPDFTFIPNNLFYSCGFCNSSSIKGQKNTIDILNQRYDLVTFRIAHPLYDNPNNEILFRDADRVILDTRNSTRKGKRTILFFQYHKPIMTTIRARQLLYERLNPIATEDQKILIQEAIAYKK